MSKKTLEERFWLKVNIIDLSSCWEWTGNKNRDGYGRIPYHNKSMRAHRMAWIFAHGDIPKGMFVCHHCDNPACVNPSHLFLGTQKDNIKDRDFKNRQSRQVGELSPSHKLNKQNVLEIRSSSESERKLGAKFGVSHTVIGQIKRRQTYFNI
jgi:hypothetical protein